MAAPEANQISSRIISIDEESNIIVLDGVTNIVEIGRKPLVINCPKCCIPVMTVVNKKANISGCCCTICTFFAELCCKVVFTVTAFVITCGYYVIIQTECKWFDEADGFWKYVLFCPECRFEIATYKPSVGCIEICVVSMLLVLFWLLVFLAIWANLGNYW